MNKIRGGKILEKYFKIFTINNERYEEIRCN